MMTMKKIFAFAVIAAIFSACRMDGTMSVESFPGEGVFAVVNSPVKGDVGTKALAENFSFSFGTGDRMLVFPQTGSEYMVYTLTPFKGMGNKAVLSVEGFSMKDGIYYAVYPAVENAGDPEKIVLPLSGQVQESNNSTAHLSAYDYSCASAEIQDNSGSFDFVHQVSWLRISFPAGQRNTNFKGFVISADNGVADTLVLNARTGLVTSGKSAADTLNFVVGGDSGVDLELGDTLFAYICVPPDIYHNLTVRTVNSTGRSDSYSFPGDCELKNGHYYQVNIGETDVLHISEIEDFGLYRCDADGYVQSWIRPIVKYRKNIDQMSWYKDNASIVFEFFELWSENYASFNLASGSISVGGDYDMAIYTGEGNFEGRTFKAVFKNAQRACLLDAEDGLGCIIKIGE